MPNPKHNSQLPHPSTRTLELVPARELRKGDCPVSLAGWRPIRKLRLRPRAKTMLIWTDAGKREVLADAPILTRRA